MADSTPLSGDTLLAMDLARYGVAYVFKQPNFVRVLTCPACGCQRPLADRVAWLDLHVSELEFYGECHNCGLRPRYRGKLQRSDVQLDGFTRWYLDAYWLRLGRAWSTSAVRLSHVPRFLRELVLHGDRLGWATLPWEWLEQLQRINKSVWLELPGDQIETLAAEPPPK